MAKEKSESELIGGEFYLIDEKKCLYKSIEDDGIFYREKGEECSQDKTPDRQMITLHGLVLQ